MTKLDKNLDYSTKEGVAHSFMVGAGENYLGPYAIALGASDAQVGLLSSIPKLLGSLSQLFSTRITEGIGSRKKMVLLFSLIQSLIWIPIALLIFLGGNVVWNLILFVSVYWITGSIIVPAWSSWIGDLVPEKIQGRFFGKRSMFTGFSLFLSISIAGPILFFSSKYNPLLGFIIIFLIAFISKFSSWIYLKKTEEGAFHVFKESRFSFLDFIKRMPKTNFGKFVIFLVLMTFSVNIASPYFSIYLLKDLKLDYLTYTVIIGSSEIAKLIFITIWGKYSDFFGNRKIISLTGYLMFIVPLLWIFSTNIFYLIAIQIVSGFVWSGFNISTFNFIFDTVSPSKRVRCVSYYNVLDGLALFLGTFLGGLLLKFGNQIFLSGFFFILIISSIGRLLSALIMLPKIKEVRWVKGISEKKLLTHIALDTFEGMRNPVVFLYEKRSVIKSRWEITLEKIAKFIEKVLGKRHKYS